MIVGADTTGAHYPTKGLGGDSLGDLGFVATGHIRLIVPQEDWARSVDPGWQTGDPLPGGDITVTIASQRACDQGSTHNAAVVVTAGEERFIGPFDPARYNDSNGMTQLTYSGVTSLTIRPMSL